MIRIRAKLSLLLCDVYPDKQQNTDGWMIGTCYPLKGVLIHYTINISNVCKKLSKPVSWNRPYAYISNSQLEEKQRGVTVASDAYLVITMSLV